MPMSDKSKYKILIEVLAKAVGVIAAFSIVLSIIYDWGFFYPLNISFDVLPTSLSDHFRSTLLLVPIVSLMALGYVLGSAIPNRLSGGKTNEEIVEEYKSDRKLMCIKELPFVGLCAISVGFALYYILYGGHKYVLMLPFGLLVLWVVGVTWYLSNEKIRNRFSKISARMLFFAPPIFMWSFFLGYTNATFAMNESDAKHIIYLQNENVEFNATVLRSFDKCIVYKPQGKRSVIILDWNRVKQVEMIEQYKPFEGVISKIYNASENATK